MKAPFLFLFCGLLAAVGGYWYFGDPSLTQDIKIITEIEEVEFPLKQFESLLGVADYAAYRNHIYRVLTYTTHFLNGDETYMHIIGPALVYHDIGLWTAKRLSYLEPGIDRAKEDYGPALNAEENLLMRDIIYFHHKFTPYVGLHADVVNAVRKADWIDATHGLISQGMPRKIVEKVEDAIPNNGFHKMLAEFGSKLYGSDVFRIIREISTIYKW